MSDKESWLKAAGVNTITVDVGRDGVLFFRIDTQWGRGSIDGRGICDNPTLRQIVTYFYRNIIVHSERILANPDASDSLRSAVQNRIAAASSVLATLAEAP